MLNVVLAAQMVGSPLRVVSEQRRRRRFRKQMLTLRRFTIGIVQQVHRMQERLVRNRPRWLWAPAPGPRRKAKDLRRAAEDS